MSDVLFLIFSIICIIGAIFVGKTIEDRKKIRQAALPPVDNEAIAIRAQESEYGITNTVMICPHCQLRGQVRTKPVLMKKGVSGAKATAAVFTAGISLVATGLSRKENLTKAWCGSCNNTWVF